MSEIRTIASRITWERLREVFGNPGQPTAVWERQFDYHDDVLLRLARTPYAEIDFGDLWYYHHDLAYVKLQPDLFRYLFPVCLMDWHQSLAKNDACSHGDSEFHYGVRRGKILETMVTPEQRDAIFEFIRDSFLERLDAERGLVYSGGRTPAYGWISRFNSVGLIMPRIDFLWEDWWSVHTPGRAVAVLQYCSGLMYPEGANPLVAAWTAEHGGGGPYLWENDSLIFDAGWMSQNVEFLTRTLTADYVTERIASAVARLKGDPAWEQARRMEHDRAKTRDLLNRRVAELPVLLGRPREIDGWRS